MKKFRNILAMLMVFVMLVAVMPMNVFAEGEDKPTEPAVTVTSIAIDTNSTYKTEYKVGDSLDVSGLKIKVTKSDNSEETVDVTSDMVTGFDSKAAAESQTLTITYQEKTVTYNVKIAAATPAVTVTSIAIDTNSTYKTEYKVGDSLDVSGLKIKVTKSDNSEETVDVTSDMVTGFDSKAAAESQTLTITYQEKTTTYTVKIKAKEVEVKKFKLTAKVEGEGGKVDPSSEKEYEKNTKVTITIKANEGYELDEVKVNNVDKKADVKDNKLEITMDAEKIVVVKFKKKTEPKPETKEYTISKAYTNHGSFTVSKSKAKAGETITVTAKPYSGYAVKNVYYIDNNNIKHSIKNYAYNDYYYYGYNGRYYNDYNYYYSDYRNYYYNDYATYEDYLKDRHYSFWKNNYRYGDYDYKYYNKYYDRYYDDYYRYYDDYVDNYYRRYSSYEDYLYDKHYSHYRDYRYYDKYDYRYYNYTTTDTFTMPASDVTVYVEFTDWSYYGYYYDDYYYYRYHRDKKDKEKEEKAEEEKKPAEEKTPQVYEASATINVGSKVFTKVNKNVTTTHQMDVAAYVKNGRVMLPLRYVAEALGLQVSWVPETKTVIIWDLTQRVEIPIKSNKMIVNGITYTSDVKPEINNSRTMLPIANVARALGLIDGTDIIWDPVMKQVKLTRRVLSK
ncbi:stalk domain-containing protein [uncultured Fenollaria sp.]|uniref:stalk domain-containing protein n=1 Tax=uncultured Fenollaria sp. TaxID=1686315 RepID=UPI0025D98DDC|nr:stalk domain-containing protein [uncultured Fenollaria sp.]